MSRRLIWAVGILTIQLVFSSSPAAPTPQDQLTRARALKAGGVLMDAASVYEEYLKRVPDNTEARIELIEIYLTLNRWTNAEPHIAVVRREKPDDLRVRQFAKRADDYYAANKERRRAEFEQKINQPNPSPDDIIEYARFCAANNETAKSYELYTRYLKLKPNDNTVKFEFARRNAWDKRYGNAIELLSQILRSVPNHTEARLLLANIFYWQGREDESVAEYQKLLKISPNHQEALRQVNRITNTPSYKERRMLETVKRDPRGPSLIVLAQFYLDQGRIYEADSLVLIRLEAASDDIQAQNLFRKIEELKRKEVARKIEALEEKLRYEPNDSAALIELARYYATIPEFDKAIEAYNTYLKTHPLDYRARLRKAEVLSWSGNHNEAIQEYRIITVVIPEDRDALLGLADALIAAGVSLEEARDLYLADLKKHPNDLYSLTGYAESLRRLGLYADAERVYNAVLKIDPDNEIALNGLNLLNKDLNPLIEKLLQHLEARPNDNEARRRLAGLLYDAKRYFEAEDQVRKLLEIFPEDSGLKAFLREIEQKQSLEMSKELLAFKQLVQTEPDNFEARLNYARRLAAEGRTKEAVAQYKLLRENRPLDDSLTVEYAEQLIYDKQLKEAHLLYSQLAENNPGRWEYRYRTAQILSWLGDNENALKEYERAQRLNPESLEVQLAIADAYRWSGNTYAAFDAYNQVLTIDPRNSKAQKALEDMNGPFFRGLQAAWRNIQDSEKFHLRETRGLGIVSASLRTQLRAGGGQVQFDQPDSARRFDYLEKGRFWLVGGIYHFDEATWAEMEVKFYQYVNRKSTCYYAILVHDFRDVPELNGLTGRVGYSSQDAFFDLASTFGLQTWNNSLRSDIFTLAAEYVSLGNWRWDGQMNYLSISDGNSRMDTWGRAMYALRDRINLGIRYDNVTARQSSPDYWSPKVYESVVGLVGVHNDLRKWRYEIIGGVGMVLSTKFAIRQLEVNFGYRIGTRFDFGLSYTSLRSIRADGEYRYSGISGYITWNM